MSLYSLNTNYIFKNHRKRQIECKTVEIEQ